MDGAQTFRPAKGANTTRISVSVHMCSDGHDPRTCFQRRMCNQVCASPQQQGCWRKRGTEHQRRRRLRTSSTTGESTGNMRAVFPTTTTTPRKYSTSCESLTLKAILESRGTPEAKTARRFYDALKHRAHKHADTYVPAKQNTQPGEDTSAQITARGTSNAPWRPVLSPTCASVEPKRRQ